MKLPRWALRSDIVKAVNWHWNNSEWDMSELSQMDMDNKSSNDTTNTEISHQEKMILQVFIGISFFLYNILTKTYEQIKYSNESLV